MEKHGDSSHEDESQSEGELSAGDAKGTYTATNPVLIDVFQPPNVAQKNSEENEHTEKQEERNNEKNAKENGKEKKKTKGKEGGRKDAMGKESEQQKKTSSTGNARNPKPKKETGGIGDRRLFLNVAPWNVTSSAPSGDYIHNIHRKWWFDYTLLEQHHG